MKQQRVIIKNLGRLSEADIRLGGFTVFVGKNNSGKSFASKGIYSLFRALSGFSLHDYVDDLRLKLLRAALIVEGNPKNSKKGLQKQINALFEDVSDVDTSRGIVEHFRQKEKGINDLLDAFDKADDIKAMVNPSNEKIAKARRNPRRGHLYADAAHRYLSKLEDFPKYPQSDTAREVRKNLLGNFQAAHRDDTFRGVGAPIRIELENVTRFVWGKGKCVVEFSDVNELTHFFASRPPPFFMESPIYAKLKVALDTLGRNMLHPHFRRGGMERRALVPTHYTDLYNALAETLFVNDDADDRQNGFKKIANDIFEAVGGKLEFTEKDDILYHSESDGKTHILPLVATGIANLGMLGLLVEHRLLQEKSYLFIDEPEAHLHPEWTVKMADALLALVEQGVNVVVATHSSVFLKWIEVRTAENPELAEKFAINHFVDGKVEQNDDLDFEMKLNEVQLDISKPYGRLYLRGLGL